MRILFYLVRSALLLAALTVGLHAAEASGQTGKPAQLGLPRIETKTGAATAAGLAPGKFSSATFAVAGAGDGRALGTNRVDYLALAPATRWSSPLRGAGQAATFVSVMLHGSRNTVIDIGGARIGVTDSPVSGALQLLVDDDSAGPAQWRPLHYHIGTGVYGGKPMAALPVLTVALEPEAGLWHLYAGARLIAANLPLMGRGQQARVVTITPGQHGAWLCGVILADENPLYADSNENAIDDAFERQAKGGALLPATAPLAERIALARQWMDAQRRSAIPGLRVKRPLPDPR
jgi:hypothetical protein